MALDGGVVFDLRGKVGVQVVKGELKSRGWQLADLGLKDLVVGGVRLG